MAVADRLASPPGSQQRRHLFENPAAIGAERAKRLSLAGLVQADHEAQEKTALRQPVDLGQ